MGNDFPDFFVQFYKGFSFIQFPRDDKQSFIDGTCYIGIDLMISTIYFTMKIARIIFLASLWIIYFFIINDSKTEILPLKSRSSVQVEKQ